MAYQHPGTAWTDIECSRLRLVYCDVCAEDVRRERRERFEDHDYAGQRAWALTTGEQVGYYMPDADDRCDRCGVRADQQHASADT